MENNNFKFKELSDKLRLSQKEKDFYRGEIVKFMDRKTPIQISHYKEETISSSYFAIFTKKHFILTSLVIIVFLSTGLIVSAEQALPNDYLYQMKIKIIEPTKILFTPTIKKKNELRVKLVDNTLKEFSQVSLKKNINQKDKMVIINSISSNIKEVNSDISKLNEKKDTSNSLKTANDLKSVLSAHNIILNKINESNSKTDNTNVLSSEIGKGLDLTQKTVDTLVETIQTSDQSTIDQTIDNQKEKINATMKDIQDSTSDNSVKQKQNDINSVNQSGTTDLTQKGTQESSIGMEQNITSENKTDSKQNVVLSDQSSIDEKLSEINTIKEEGDKKLIEGKKNEAFILYNQVDQKLGELKSLINSEKELGIDIISNNNK